MSISYTGRNTGSAGLFVIRPQRLQVLILSSAHALPPRVLLPVHENFDSQFLVSRSFAVPKCGSLESSLKVRLLNAFVFPESYLFIFNQQWILPALRIFLPPIMPRKTRPSSTIFESLRHFSMMKCSTPLTPIILSIFKTILHRL